jgi:hypothetical protein
VEFRFQNGLARNLVTILTYPYLQWNSGSKIDWPVTWSLYWLSYLGFSIDKKHNCYNKESWNAVWQTTPACHWAQSVICQRPPLRLCVVYPLSRGASGLHPMTIIWTTENLYAALYECRARVNTKSCWYISPTKDKYLLTFRCCVSLFFAPSLTLFSSFLFISFFLHLNFLVPLLQDERKFLAHLSEVWCRLQWASQWMYSIDGYSNCGSESYGHVTG